MDTILNTPDILNEANWLHFRLYKDPTTTKDWISNLDWYHNVLLGAVKPLVEEREQIRAVFFGLYGPEEYRTETNETYERQIANARNNLNANAVYVRLRLSVGHQDRAELKDDSVRMIESNKPNPVWDYETIEAFRDLGPGIGDRYGSGDNRQTLQFIRYWDSACRYILSILAMPNNWKEDVDVWGIPHLVNNSLGGILRCSQYTPSPARCQNCSRLLYLETSTSEIQFSSPRASAPVPLLLARCPSCGRLRAVNLNI